MRYAGLESQTRIKAMERQLQNLQRQGGRAVSAKSKEVINGKLGNL
jgi:hypothetical protein